MDERLPPHSIQPESGWPSLASVSADFDKASEASDLSEVTKSVRVFVYIYIQYVYIYILLMDKILHYPL